MNNRRSPKPPQSAADLKSMMVLELRRNNWTLERIAGFIQACETFGALRSGAPDWLRAHTAQLIASQHGIDGNTTAETTAACAAIIRAARRNPPAVGEADVEFSAAD